MSQVYTVSCLSTALSPMTQMKGVAGNESLVNREPVVTAAGVRWVPCLSGNALRNRLVRSPGARFLVERWGLAGALTMRQLNFLAHGGNLTESSARQDPRGFATFHRLFPLYRLIGGSLPDAIVPGSLICDRGVLVCRENLSRLRAMSPGGWAVPDGLRPAEAFVEGYQYVRSDCKTTMPDLVNPAEELLSTSNLMIFSGQSVIAGAGFLHGFVIQRGSELELGALLLSLALWQESGATVGGQSARGHGRLETLVHCAPAVDAAALMRAYVDHVDSVREDAVEWLRAAFEPPPAKPEKARGKKAGTIDPTLGAVL